MKRAFKIFFLITILGLCNSCNSILDDCFYNGKDITVTYDLNDSPFEKIIIYDNIRLKIEQSSGDYSMSVFYNEDLLDNIEYLVDENLLQIRNNKKCKLIDKNQIPEITIQVPNLTSIQNSSVYEVYSSDTLNFANISLISLNNALDRTNIGDFKMILKSDEINISANGFSNFEVEGECNTMDVKLSAGNPPFLNARNLKVKDITIVQASVNDAILSPTNSLKGKITGVGDIILTTRPPVVEILETYKGRLIYE